MFYDLPEFQSGSIEKAFFLTDDVSNSDQFKPFNSVLSTYTAEYLINKTKGSQRQNKNPCAAGLLTGKSRTRVSRSIPKRLKSQVIPKM